MKQFDDQLLHKADVENYVVEIGWSATLNTFFAEIIEDSAQNEEHQSVQEIGFEPESYHRLDYLVRDINSALGKMHVKTKLSVPARLFDFIERGQLPQTLIDQINSAYTN